MNTIIKEQLLIGIFQTGVALVFLMMMIYRIRVFMVKMKLISDAIVYFKKEDLERILDYWLEAHHKFKQAFAKYRHISYSSRIKIKESRT